MTNSFIAIKGNYLNDLKEILNSFRYIDLNENKLFDNFDNANNYLSDNYFKIAKSSKALRGFWYDNNWTIISDPELVDVLEKKALIEISKLLNTEIWTFIIQTNSNTFGFAKYYKKKVRQFTISDNAIIQNYGTPISEEVNFNQNFFADDIKILANKLGIDIDGKLSTTFILKELGYNDELNNELASFKNKNMTLKPWWKFW